MAAVEVDSHARDVFRAEDAGGRCRNRLLEERAIQHLHGAVDGRGKHVGRIVRHRSEAERLSFVRVVMRLVSMLHES